MPQPHAVQPSECAQARAAASLRLDGELAELDVARLRAHMQRCAECRAFAEEIGRAAALLRGASLEQATFGSFREPQPGTARVAVPVAAVAVVVAAAAAAAQLAS